MGYISRVAGILLWILGLIITSTVIYFVYSAAVPYVAPFGGLALSRIANPRWDCHIGVLGFRSFTWRFRSVTLRSQSDGSNTPLATKDANT